MRGRLISVLLLILVLCPQDGQATPAAEAGRRGVPLVGLSGPLAHPDIVSASTGAPQDSLVMRVSIGFRIRDGISDPFITIEEIVAPLPVVVRLDLPGDQDVVTPEPREMINGYEVDGREFLERLLASRPPSAGSPGGYGAWNFTFGSWLSPRTFSLSVMENGRRISALISRERDGGYRAAPVDGETAFALRTRPLDALIMPAEVLQMVTGRPAQSLVLRVSVTGAPTRCGEVQSVVIEELGWPPPGMVMMRGSGHEPARQEFFRTHGRWLRAGRIGQDTLHEWWGEIPRQPKMLWSGRMESVEFRAWLAPNTFVLGSREVGLVIKRSGEGEYSLVEAAGDFMNQPPAP